MTQKFEYRGIPVPGVTRSCNDRCDPDCAKHTWGWTLEWTGRDGCRKRDGNRGYRTGREAMLAREIAWQAVKEGLAPGKKMTVAEWLTEWIEDRESPQSDRPLEPTTAATYRRHIELYLIPQLGRVRLDKLTPMDVGSCLRRVRDERDAERKLAKAAGKPAPRAIGPTTAARIRATLSSALADAAELELVSRNVAGVTRNHRRREDEHRELPRVWQPTQLFGFLKALAEAEERLYPMIMLAAFTGLRRGELLGLRWSDVDLDDRSLLVQWQRTTIGYKVLKQTVYDHRSRSFSMLSAPNFDLTVTERRYIYLDMTVSGVQMYDYAVGDIVDDATTRHVLLWIVDCNPFLRVVAHMHFGAVHIWGNVGADVYSGLTATRSWPLTTAITFTDGIAVSASP